MPRLILVVPILLLFACRSDRDSAPAGSGDLTGPCQNSDQHCNSSGDCCGTLLCNSNKVCFNGNCQGEGTACSSSSQCCGTLTCANGLCR
ncbi:MAG: hypothetical protein AAB262_03580 [Elusimicrobiota bacterium]